MHDVEKPAVQNEMGGWDNILEVSPKFRFDGELLDNISTFLLKTISKICFKLKF